MSVSGTPWLVAEVLKESQRELSVALFIAFILVSLICYNASKQNNFSSSKNSKNFQHFADVPRYCSSQYAGEKSSLKRPSVYSHTHRYTCANNCVSPCARPHCRVDIGGKDEPSKKRTQIHVKNNWSKDSSFHSTDIESASVASDFSPAESVPLKYVRLDDGFTAADKTNFDSARGEIPSIQNVREYKTASSRRTPDKFLKRTLLQGGSSEGTGIASPRDGNGFSGSQLSCEAASRRSPYPYHCSPKCSNLWSRIHCDEDSPTVGRKSTGGFSETSGLVGLRNIGNTCFLNSVVQCLSNTRCLLEYLVKEEYSSEINTSLSTMKGDLIRAFSNLISDMWTEGDSNRALNTGPFKTQIQKFAPTFTGYQQHDAQEFLRKLLEGLHEDVNRVVVRPRPIHTDIDDDLNDDQKAMESWKRYLRFDDSKIVDMFVGQLKSSLQCSYCSHTSVTFDPFWDLSLPIPGKSGNVKLNHCLDLFTKEEVMDGDERPTCSKCKERRKMTKSFSIQKFPKVLVLHLKRFSPTERWRGKLTCTVEFPVEGLDLSRYASNSRSSSSYNLIGVANHSGTTYSGHYTAFCRHPYSQQWHEYNDSRVAAIPARRVCSPEAYVLFYELASTSKL